MQSAILSASKQNDVQPIAYWINLDRSEDRRYHMANMLNYWKMPHKRVKAYTPDDMEVSKRLLNYSHCEIQDVESLYASRIGNQRPPVKPHIRVVELCGRPRNLLTELAGTIGHLMAIYNGVHSPDKSPYALILEDDVNFGFHIDFNELVKTAPNDWLILQLLTSNDNRVTQLWENYQKKRKDLWIGRRIRGPHHMDFWCAGAYLVNKAKMKPFIDRIFNVHPNGTIDLRIIAAYHRPCYPIGCCHEHDWLPPKHPPCIYSPRGFGADDFIYALGQTYVMTVPVVGGAGVGNTSTIHQYEVKRHVNAFRIIDNLWKEMRNGKVELPAFIQNHP